MAWSTSNRRDRLPDDWWKRRAQVKARAKSKCQASVHHPKCDGTGTDADHIIEGDDHSLENLQWLSSPCHKAKTSRENARRNQQRAALRNRPAEQHPGRIAP